MTAIAVNMLDRRFEAPVPNRKRVGASPTFRPISFSGGSLVGRCRLPQPPNSSPMPSSWRSGRGTPPPRPQRTRPQRTRAVAQNFGERIGECPWLGKLENFSLGHGVSLLQWRSGGVEHPHDTPPNPSCRHQLSPIAHPPFSIRLLLADASSPTLSKENPLHAKGLFRTDRYLPSPAHM
jgi:hypothetical protein